MNPRLMGFIAMGPLAGPVAVQGGSVAAEGS